MQKLVITFIALLVSSCSLAPAIKNNERIPNASLGARLPDHFKWESLESYVNNLNLNQPDLTLLPSTGGTSVYVMLKQNGKLIGAVLPENSATILSGEILTFNLARAFGYDAIYQPAFSHFLTGANLAPFRRVVETVVAKNKNKTENKVKVLAELDSHPEGIKTIFKQFGVKPQDYDGIVNSELNSINLQHYLNGSQYSVGELLSCSGKKPSSSLAVSANGGTTTELIALKQISNILLTDALTQQWDRFSGGNFQTVTENGVVKFVSFDNGGTWGGASWTQKMLSYVTRFDKNTADKILQLDKYFKEGKPFLNLKNDQELKEAFDIVSYPKILDRLKMTTDLVARHIRSHPNCYF